MKYVWVRLTFIVIGSLWLSFTSATITPFTSCGFGLVTRMKCCNLTFIFPEDISVDFMVEATGNERNPWRLGAVVQWPPPTGTANYSYSVQFLPTIEPSKAANPGKTTYANYLTCPPGRFTQYNSSVCPSVPTFSTVTTETSATFGDLFFGFEYFFRIQVIADDVIAAFDYCFTACSDCGDTTAPDCLSATNDEKFCEEQILAVATKPFNFTVELENVTGDVRDSFLYLSWTEPKIHKNGTLVRYNVVVHKNNDESFAYEIRVEAPNTSCEILYKELELSLTETDIQATYYDISIAPSVDLSSLQAFRLLDGPTANIRFNASTIVAAYLTSPRPSDPTTPPAATKPGPDIPQEGSTVNIFPIIIGTSVLALVLVIVLVFSVIFCLMKPKSQTKTNQSVFVPQHHQLKPKKTVTVLPEFRDKEIPEPDSLKVLGDPIGAGQYGKVYLGLLCDKAGGEFQVAVKTTRDGLTAAMKEEFLDEIRLMLEIGEHPNILKLVGCQTVQEPYYLITEYMEYGSLKDYFKKCRKPEFGKKNPVFILTDYLKLGMSHQICEGMVYLSSTRYFHGDLAARNVLINQKMEVKISDFGLSNDIYQRGYFRLPPEEKRPVKWYSPEANIHGRCSTEGDVWSYGIVLYEIYTVGGEPYPGMAPREVITRIKRGYRMEKPENCPDKIYDIMLNCWQYDASDRPTFNNIRTTLEEFVETPEILFGPLNDIEREEIGLEISKEGEGSCSSEEEDYGISTHDDNPLNLRIPVASDVQDRYSIASFVTDHSLNSETDDIQLDLDDPAYLTLSMGIRDKSVSKPIIK